MFDDEPYEVQDLQLLGINFDGPVASLPPGSTNQITLYFHAAQAGSLEFKLDALTAADEREIDWGVVDEAIRPDDADPDMWDPMFADLTARIGSTWGDYVHALIASATVRAAAGERVYDVRALFAEQVGLAYATGETTVTGYVRAAEDGEPIADALVHVVRASETSGGGGASDTTDAQGRFAAQHLAPGTYNVVAEGYWPAQVVEVPLNVDVVEVDLAVYPAATITGTVRDAVSGAVLPNVTVSANGETGEGGASITGTDGYYAISELPSGTYTISTAADQYVDQVLASEITLQAGEIVADVDFNLARGGYITGRVTDSDTGDPIANASIVAVDELGAGQFASTNTNGDYEVTGLAAGDWEVSVRSSTHLSPEPEVVTVTPPHATVLNRVLVHGASISGSVFDQDSGYPIEGAAVSALSTDSSELVLAVTDEFGAYEISPLATGTYTVTAKADFHVSAGVADLAVTGEEALTDINFNLPAGACPRRDRHRVQAGRPGG